jgi:nicotinamide-nucleotide amidase
MAGKEEDRMAAGSGSPTCEIVTIGSELLIGQIVDTNTATLARDLIWIGVPVRFRTSVGDTLADMVNVILDAVKRCDMVIATGGLGPTEDDLTRQAIADAAGVSLEFRQDLMEQIEDIFRRSGYKMPDNNRRQAFVPAGSHVIPNPVGTAPAFITEVRGRPVIALPGVPRELKYLMSRSVLPWIREKFDLGASVIVQRIVKVAGLGESAVDKVIGDLMGEGKNPEVGLLASPGEITIRITVRAGDGMEAQSLIDPVEREIRERLGDKVFGGGDDTLEIVVEALLKERGMTIAILETFTGGLAALRVHQLHSDQLAGSKVMPDMARLCRWLGKGEDSPILELAGEAARRVSAEFGSSLGVACLGFPKKEGAVYQVEGQIAVVGEPVRGEFSWTMGGDVTLLQQRGSVICLNTLRLALLEIQPPA